MDVDVAVQEQLDELREAVHGLRKMLVRNGAPETAASVAAVSPVGDAAILDALHEVNEQLRRIRCDGVISEADAQRIVEAIEDYFVVDDEEGSEQSGKSKRSSKAKSKSTAPKDEDPGEEDEAPPTRRGYFPNPEA